MQKNNYLIPVAIIVAGVIIGAAVLYSNRSNNLSLQIASLEKTSQEKEEAPPSFGSGPADKIKPVSGKDHILGNLEAMVKVIEFSDTECPFCKRFHPTMKQIIDEYGKNGEVAWVYRHFPLDSIHLKARKEAQALECASELGGNKKFWDYLDQLFEVTPSNDQLDLSLLPQIGEDAGLNRQQFEECIKGDEKGGKYAEHIEENLQDAIASGAQGTPYSVVIAKNNKKFVINGAQPYSEVKSVIEAALKEN